MKKLILSAAIATALAATAVAAPQDKPSDSQKPAPVQASQAARSMHGTIQSVDKPAKTFVMKDEATGQEVTVYWNGSTKLTGDLKVGSEVSLQATERSGRQVATSIEATSAKKPY